MDQALATSASGAPCAASRRAWRTKVAADLAACHDGVAHRRDLRRRGVSRVDLRTEVAAGRWRLAGRHTVVIAAGELGDRARLWQAVWESGAGAALDGASALIAAGLRGFEPDRIDVCLPANNRRHRLDGVRLHRRHDVGPVISVGLPRARPEQAAIRAAQWAATDRTAMLIICLVVQQRLVAPNRLLAAWARVGRTPRRELLGATIRDVCDGAQSLGELDFGRWCRRYGIPEPSRQVVRSLPSGRVYLDVLWEGLALVVEIDGGHHALALNPVDDALRQNDIVLGEATVLRIPVLGLRLAPDRFMEQVARAHRLLARPAV